VNWRTGAKPLVGDSLANDPWPVAAKDLLTERERSLYQSLSDLYPDHKLFVQVALSQLIDVPEDHPERPSIRNQFSQLVADFVLCRSNLSVIAVIELDDRSHERPDRQRADARKNKALADAGIRLVRIPAGQLPTLEKLRALVDADRPCHDRTDIPTLHASEPELRLVEEADDPFLLASTDHSESGSRVFKTITRKIILGGVLVVGGWFVYSQFIPFAMQRAFQPLAITHAPAASAPKSRIVTSTRSPMASVVVGPTTEESAQMRQAQSQAAKAMQQKKDQAWAAFYTAPASCEHPADWGAQVECGNRYMRAKKVFEQRWAAEHPSISGNGAEVVPDGSSSVPGPHR